MSKIAKNTKKSTWTPLTNEATNNKVFSLKFSWFDKYDTISVVFTFSVFCRMLCSNSLSMNVIQPTSAVINTEMLTTFLKHYLSSRM